MPLTPSLVEDSSRDRKFENDKVTWADVTHCWKLEISQTLEAGVLARLDKKYGVDDVSSIVGELRSPVNVFLFLTMRLYIAGLDLTVPKVSECSPVSRDEERVQRWSGLKRCHDSYSGEDSSSSGRSRKRQKIAAESLEECTLAPEIHCGLYGLHLLRSAWDRTHGIVVLLKGAQFNGFRLQKAHSDRLQIMDSTCSGMTVRAALQLQRLM